MHGRRRRRSGGEDEREGERQRRPWREGPVGEDDAELDVGRRERELARELVGRPGRVQVVREDLDRLDEGRQRLVLLAQQAPAAGGHARMVSSRAESRTSCRGAGGRTSSCCAPSASPRGSRRCRAATGRCRARRRLSSAGEPGCRARTESPSARRPQQRPSAEGQARAPAKGEGQQEGRRTHRVEHAVLCPGRRSPQRDGPVDVLPEDGSSDYPPSRRSALETSRAARKSEAARSRRTFLGQRLGLEQRDAEPLSLERLARPELDRLPRWPCVRPRARRRRPELARQRPAQALGRARGGRGADARLLLCIVGGRLGSGRALAGRGSLGERARGGAKGGQLASSWSSWGRRRDRGRRTLDEGSVGGRPEDALGRASRGVGRRSGELERAGRRRSGPRGRQGDDGGAGGRTA